VYLFDFSSENARCFAINGEKDYQTEDLEKILRLSESTVVQRFFCDQYTLSTLLETLTNQESSSKGQRPERSAGVALKVGIELLKSAAAGTAGKILLYLSGAPTSGPGKVAGLSTNEPLRTFIDIKNNKAGYLSKAKNFYDSLANDLQVSGHSIDIFSCSIDQSGLFEMENLTQKTGGYLFLYDSCASIEFKSNFLRYFSDFLVTFSRCSVIVHCSEGLEICGCVSLGFSIQNVSKSSSSIQVGLSGSNKWGINTIDKNTTFTFFFHPKNKKNNKPTMVQVETRGISNDGKMKTWVKLFVFKNPDGESLGFNCETSAVITAKLAVWRLKTEDFLTVSNWIDNSLISFTKRFSKIEGKNVLIPSEISLFPQFLYFLRRSQFVNSFNVSPDESAFYRQCMLRYSVQEALLMIEPVLMSFSFQSEYPEPMFLSPDELKDDRILVFDNFFQIVVWQGRAVCAWVKEGYDKLPEYQHVKELVESPLKYAEELALNRFPLPKIVKTRPRDGQERLIKARLDTKSNGLQETEIFSDVMSIEAFVERLKMFVLK
jgi:protein transport protein SEC23